MNSEIKGMLERWNSLRESNGLETAARTIRKLWFVAIALTLVLAYCIIYKLHPIITVIPAIALGWVIAERNALRSRRDQWPVISNYIDWQRVENDLRNS